MAVGRTVRLFMVDGAPTGLITAEVMNWTGHILKGPRSRLADILLRPESGRTGVYLLTGNDPEHPARQRIYVGEGDNISDRLKNHVKDASKDFWTNVTVITSKDGNITKSHARYLESRVVDLAKKAGRYSLANGNEPSLKILPESDIADMEYFIHQLQIVLPLIDLDFMRNVDNFLQISITATAMPAKKSPVFVAGKKSQVWARAVEDGDEFVVLEGSRATTKSDFVSNTYGSLRKSLIDQDVLNADSDPDFLVFTKNFPFASPSAAAAVVLNRNANGRTEWKVEATGQTLKNWQDDLISALPIGEAPQPETVVS